jgi:hypothetical protein
MTEGTSELSSRTRTAPTSNDERPQGNAVDAHHSSPVEDAFGELGDFPVLHQDLLSQYVLICSQFAIARAQGHGFRGEAFVKDHMTSCARDLHDCYLRLAQSLSVNAAARTWLTHTAADLIRFVETLADVSPWRGIRVSVKTVRGLGLVAVAVVGISLIGDEIRQQSKDADWNQILTLAGFAGGCLLATLALWALVLQERFLQSRNFLLGGEDDGRWIIRNKHQLLSGSNIYELENELFRALGSARRGERQIDLLIWSVLLGTPALVGVTVYKGSGSRFGPEILGYNLVGAGLLLLFVVAVGLPLLRERTRKWGLYPDPRMRPGTNSLDTAHVAVTDAAAPTVGSEKASAAAGQK